LFYQEKELQASQVISSFLKVHITIEQVFYDYDVILFGKHNYQYVCQKHIEVSIINDARDGFEQISILIFNVLESTIELR